MKKMTVAELKRCYDENSAIAALAVIVEDEEKGKKRASRSTIGYTAEIDLGSKSPREKNSC